MSTVVPENLQAQGAQRLPQGAPIPGLPQTGNLDSMYLAQEAQLRAQIARQYADILQQLGWMDSAGNFIPGSVSVTAARAQADQQYQSDQATQGVNDQATRTNTGFSGRRPVNIAKAQRPYQDQIARLGVDTPLKLGGLAEQAAGIIDQYTLQNNILLQQMALRQAQAIANRPGDQTNNPPTPNELDPNGAISNPPGWIQNPPNQTGGAGQVNVPVQVGSNVSMEPKPGPGNFIPAPNNNPQLPQVQPTPTAAPGSVFTPDTSGAGAGEMPHPNPASYDQPVPAGEEGLTLGDMVNQAINDALFTPPPNVSTTTNSGGTTYTQTNQGPLGKKPLL